MPHTLIRTFSAVAALGLSGLWGASGALGASAASVASTLPVSPSVGARRMAGVQTAGLQTTEPPATDSQTTGLHLIPMPQRVQVVPRCAVPAGGLLAGWPLGRLSAARELVLERWQALGVRPGAPALRVTSEGSAAGVPGGSGPVQTRPVESYRLQVDVRGARFDGADPAGTFYAAMTLAQLARRGAHGWEVPCVSIEDAPALRWRILSDDVSRGPLPTMRYFKERIRTLAAFKMNGYSPYMEHVFVDPQHPLPAPLDGITPGQLRELDAYARRFHVALIPEQQTFAHMHGTLQVEENAPLAELPHGYLISPAAPAGEAYVRDLIADELSVVPHPPFFHIGSDEPSDLGRGLTKPLVEASGEGPVFAKHVIDTANFVIARGGGRPLIWDDALARHPELFAQLPKSLVFVNWHYGDEPSYKPYIERIAKGGFDQMVAPGALNWNEIYPDLDRAIANIGRFVSEGKSAHVLGLFQTVWHDDGETLFEATWYPVLYAAASAWETGDVEPARYARDFPSAFFGSADARYADDFAALGRAAKLVHGNPREYGDYLFWADPFDPALANVPATLDLRALRLAAEGVLTHLRLAPPPALHANAAAVMFLAARRYDTLGRTYQITREARDYYDDARANAGTHDNFVYRGLNIAKYLFWETRDRYLELEPLVKTAWDYEDRPSGRASVLARYRLAAGRAQQRADAIDAATYDDYVAHKTLPTFDDALGLRPVGPVNR